LYGRKRQAQLPKESSILEFGFDENKELVKFVTGRCEDSVFKNAIITGGEMFSLAIDKDIENIEEFLIYCYQCCNLKKYKQDYNR